MPAKAGIQVRDQRTRGRGVEGWRVVSVVACFESRAPQKWCSRPTLPIFVACGVGRKANMRDSRVGNLCITHRGGSRSPSNGGVQRGDAPLPGAWGYPPQAYRAGGWQQRAKMAIPICQCSNDVNKSLDSYAIDNSPPRPYHCPYTPTPAGHPAPPLRRR